MYTEKIDLYNYFKIPRGAATGGYLNSYLRSPSYELKEKIRPAMLVIPGGAYMMLSEREGEPVALRFFEKGFCTFMLSYSVQTAYPVPLIEACMAVAYIRENAKEYGVDPSKVASVGFSAGGHLAGMLATMWGENEIRDALGERADLARPDAVILSYAVVTMNDEFTHCDTRKVISGDGTLQYDKFSIEKRVSSDSVPAFIWHTMEDDLVPVENSLLLASAYKRACVPFSLHIFEKGWHGLSVCNEEVFDCSDICKPLSHVGRWVDLALDWLDSRGFRLRVKEQ